MVKPSNENKDGQICLVLKSSSDPGPGSVGDIVEQSCVSLAATVCQIKTNKDLSTKEKPAEYNINEDVVANTALAFSNGTKSPFFTGLYYVIVSKYQNIMLNNEILANVSKIIFYI